MKTDAGSITGEELGLRIIQGLRVYKEMRIARDKIIPPGLYQPNAETLAAFADIERGGLKRFDSVDALFADLEGSKN